MPNLTECKYITQIGKHTYCNPYGGGVRAQSWEKGPRVFIGSFCSIAAGVSFMAGADHNIKRISTFPFRLMNVPDHTDRLDKGNIVVDHDVWIGDGAYIMRRV